MWRLASHCGQGTMFLDLQKVASALNGEVSNGQVLALGPGHSVKDRSLSVRLDSNAPDGFIVNSFASDDPIACKDYVRKRLGFPEWKPNGGLRRHRASDAALEAAIMAAVDTENSRPQKIKIIETYDYRDADGTLLYQVLRLEPKDFRQRRPDGNGKWIWKLEDRRVLYRLSELLKFPDASVFVCEGEKDADRVAELGCCATTVAAGKWTAECVAGLAGRDVAILEDNAEAGRTKALAAAQALNGAAKTIRIVSLPDLPDKGDVSDWLDANRSYSNKFFDICFAVPEWNLTTTPPTPPPAAPADQACNTRLPPEEKQTPDAVIPLPFINIAAWKDQTVPERQWTVKDRIPASNVTLLSGEGSVGKSILSLHLATAVVLGRDWLGTLPEMGSALCVCCEDDADELWRRLDLIFLHYGAACTEFENLHLISLAGQETLLAAPNNNGLIQPTQLFGRIHKAACDIQPKLIVLDNSADVYGGSENDRTQVRQFIGILRGMAIASGAGILLTSHPSLTGINTGTGLSGSTAWNASVRSRLYFKRAVTEKDEEPDPDLRVLEVMKSNYGPIGETITLRWSNGLFLPVAGMSSFERAAAERNAEDLFLNLLDEFNQQGRNTCAKPTAPTYAPTLFAKERKARKARIYKSDLEAAMRRLFEANKIGLETYGAPSRGTAKLVRK
jgi:RecA-family ATPase